MRAHRGKRRLGAESTRRSTYRTGLAILEEARSQVVRTVNSTMVLAHWQVGREIVEFVQRGAKRAGYGERVLDALSAHLRARPASTASRPSSGGHTTGR
jgi:hypothetical protein